jgi:uncharacterized protein YjbI with pentapeptide repeats
MIQAQRAPVRPRVVTDSGATLLLEDEIKRFLEAGARGLIAVLGPVGAGKTKALEHLEAVLPPGHSILLLDELDFATQSISAWVRLVVYTARCSRPERHVAVYRVAPWTRDDLIEYLLAVHGPRCAAVMRRLGDDDYSLFGGVPELWRAVLDRLAEDDALPDARRALHRHLEAHLHDTDLLERARSACLNAVLKNTDLAETLRQLARPGFAEDLIGLLRYPAAQTLLASERIAADLRGDADCDYLAARLPRDLVKAGAALITGDVRALEHLHRLLAGPTWSHAMAASLLHATGTGWRPTHSKPTLMGAYLNGAFWPGVDLGCADLAWADLSGASLMQANLEAASAIGINLSLARLHEANLEGTVAPEADLSHAVLRGISGLAAMFQGANLEGADLEGAVLRNARFAEANLSTASLRGADLSGARLSGADTAEPLAAKTNLERADFTGANLTGAFLSGLVMRHAVWTGARFTGAKMERCDLEYLTLADADFREACLRGALLTGTSMPGACFYLADLRETGLADVDWEGADLRGADLRNCTFHMGSSRSGLVGSPIACEGSRTGFYTDDYDEQTYKAPEEIRKANLCGADLRGANLEGVDFYLVDLRGALYDPDQERHLRRCGAILGTRG